MEKENIKSKSKNSRKGALYAQYDYFYGFYYGFYGSVFLKTFTFGNLPCLYFDGKRIKDDLYYF